MINCFTVDAPDTGMKDRRQWAQPWGRRGQSLMWTLQPDHIETLLHSHPGVGKGSITCPRRRQRHRR